MNEKMRLKLAEYEQASRASWDVRAAEEKAKAELDAMCGRHKAQLARSAAQLLLGARPGWAVESVRCYTLINHARRPMTCMVVARVALHYETDETGTSGELAMSCPWEGRENMLEQLRRAVQMG
jgi:hypothetical protein